MVSANEAGQYRVLARGRRVLNKERAGHARRSERTYETCSGGTK